jgi:hypothetical protein
MPSRPLSILVCLMTVLCPVFCTAELALHAHGSDGNEVTTCGSGERHTHDHGGRPHHQHDSNGDPIPHANHVCICATGAPPGPAVQIPPLEPAGMVVAQELPVFAAEFSQRLVRFASGPPDDRAAPDWNIPLLI